MSAEPASDEKKEFVIWKECTLLQTQMKKLLKSSNNPFRDEIEKLRLRLRENYLFLLEEHGEFSFDDKDILVNLWKFVFYKQIEFCRKQLRKKQNNEERLELINKLTDIIIPDAKSVYNQLLNKHLKYAHITPSIDDALLLKTKTDKNITTIQIQLSVQIAHKSLIYIGDLERYKETYLNQNYEQAKLSYCRALQLMPIRGNPHNQLAVLNQMQSNCDLAAIYRYVLSLFVKEPFMTAKENLLLLFKKTISIIDKTQTQTQSLPLHKIIRNKANTFKDIQIYIIYIFATFKTAKYHKIIHKIQPIILEKIGKILVLRDSDKPEEKEQDKHEEISIIIKQLCVISIYLVIECFNDESNYIGYKQSISWTLSLIATIIQSIIANANSNNKKNKSNKTSKSFRLLKYVNLCCLWLEKNFDFIVPDINEVPFIQMQIEQHDLKPNNTFFNHFAKLLNLLHNRYKNVKNPKPQHSKNNIITPEQIEFYGVKHLNFINFDDKKYKNNNDYIFIYHRRFCTNLQDKYQESQSNKKVSVSTLNYLRYLQLVKFAQYSSQKIEGVLVFNDNKWIANKLLAIEEPSNASPPPLPQQAPPPQRASQSPILPPIPIKQKSQGSGSHADNYYSPGFHSHAHYRDHHSNPPHSMYLNPHRNYPHSAPSSPRGVNTHTNHHNHHHHYPHQQPYPPLPNHHHQYNEYRQHQRHQHQQQHYVFKQQQPPLMEYPENEEVVYDPHGYPQNLNIIKSTPTSPNGHHPVSNAYRNYDGNVPNRYQPASLSYDNLSNTNANSNTEENKQFYLGIPSHGVAAGSGSQSQSVHTPGDTAFNFSSAYAHSAAATNAAFHPHAHHHNQPVTQPTTPVHHTSISQYHNHQQYHPQPQPQPQYAAPPRSPNSGAVLNFNAKDMNSPLNCDDIVSAVFKDLELSQQ